MTNPSPLHLTLTKWTDGVEDRYIFLFDAASSPQVMQTLGRFAGDPDLSFSWHDAALLSRKVRELTKAARRGES